MTTRVECQIICDLIDGRELTLCSRSYDEFDPSFLNKELSSLMSEATLSAKENGIDIGNLIDPQLSIALSTSEARPALHLSKEVIAIASEYGLSIDFDPYTYED